MISARCRPAIEAGQRGEWQLVLLIGEAFDYATPFRAVLDEIADALCREAYATVQFPQYDAFEDFVEGKFYSAEKRSTSISSTRWVISPFPGIMREPFAGLQSLFNQNDRDVTQGSRAHPSYSRKSGGQGAGRPSQPSFVRTTDERQ
jgi:hypothetical protein